jgi:hypothetical protein
VCHHHHPGPPGKACTAESESGPANLPPPVPSLPSQTNQQVDKERKKVPNVLLDGDSGGLTGPELAIQNGLIVCLIVCKITARLSVTG